MRHGVGKTEKGEFYLINPTVVAIFILKDEFILHSLFSKYVRYLFMINGAISEKIKINRTTMTNLKCDGRSPNKKIAPAEKFDKRKNFGLADSEYLRVHAGQSTC